jgi:hypothetical protein
VPRFGEAFLGYSRVADESLGPDVFHVACDMGGRGVDHHSPLGQNFLAKATGDQLAAPPKAASDIILVIQLGEEKEIRDGS